MNHRAMWEFIGFLSLKVQAAEKESFREEFQRQIPPSPFALHLRDEASMVNLAT
jgi:hypothetical protein